MTTNRIVLIDILRGFALIGILFANIPSIARMRFAGTEAERWMYSFIDLAFEQRFFPIFSFLFGLGFFIFMRNAEEKGLPFYRLMAWRLGLLILFGVVHQFLQPGEALLSYGILGFGLLPLYKRQPIIVLLAAVVMLIPGIWVVDYFTVLGLFYFGLFIGQIGYFDRLEDYRRPTQMIWRISLLLIIPLLWAQLHWGATNYFFVWQNMAGLVIAAFLVTSLLLWPQTERWLMPLAAFGRMALTNYILQSVIVLLIAFAFGGFDSLSNLGTPLIWLAIWPLQVLFSNLWLRRFPYGPLEWLWRKGTYGSLSFQTSV